ARRPQLLRRRPQFEAASRRRYGSVDSSSFPEGPPSSLRHVRAGGRRSVPAMSLQHGGNLFAIAREKGWDWRDIADFSASINPLGPSPAVFPAIHRALER